MPMEIARMKKILGLLIALTMLVTVVPGYAQGSNGGILYASDFAGWSLPQGTGPANGTIAWSDPSICRISSSGYNFVGPKVGRPLTIVDNGIPSHTETVLPSQVIVGPGGCSLTATMAYSHLSYSVKSGTAGLQEAIDYQTGLTQGALVVATPEWTLAGGITPMITGAYGTTAVSIEDARSPCLVAYLWSGSAYIAQSSSCGGGSTVNVNGTAIASPNFNNSVPAPDSGYTAVQWKTSGSSVLGQVVNVALPIATATTLGGVKPDGTTCTVNGTTGVLSCTGGGSSGVSSLNSLTGGLNLTSSDSSVTITPSGTSINLQAASGSGGSVISGANVVFTGDSLMVDDTQDTLGAQITATAASCTSSGLCTITAPQAYVAGQWLDFNPSGFSPSCISANRNTSYGTLGYYGTGTELYQVLPTGLSSSQFQIQTTCGATTGTGGTIEDATYFLPPLTAAQPAFTNIDSWVLRNGTDKTGAYGGITGLVCEQATNFNAMFGGLLPSVTGKPLFFLEAGGTNDLGVGVSESALEGCFQSFWAQAHAAGAKVVQNMIPYFYNNNGTEVTDVNNWLINQGKSNSNAVSGQYWDYPGVDMRVFGTVYNPFAAIQIARVAQSWDASMAAPGASGFTLTACNPETDCANLKESNHFPVSQYINAGSATGAGTVGWDANVGFGGAQLGSITNPSAGYNDTGYVMWHTGSYGYVDAYAMASYWMSSGGHADLLPGTRPVCWNPASGGELSLAAPVIGLSLDASGNYLDVGSCASVGDYTMPIRVGGLGGPATAPSGSCSLPGEWVFSQDGVATRCLSGTWTTFSGGGGGLSGMTAGQVPIAATANTVTSSMALQGTDTKILSSGSVSGSGVALCTDANGGATTSGCPSGSGGTNVTINGGSILGSLNLTGSIPATCSDSSGSGTVQSCTSSPSFTPTAGNCITYLTTTANTGTGLTINVNSSSAYSVAKWAGATTTLAAGDIPANKPIPMCFDAANHWDAMTIGNAPSGGGGVASINSNTGAFTFSGAGVSCSGTTCTFTGGTGSGTVQSGTAYSPAYYPSGGGTVVAGVTPFTGLPWYTTSAAPAQASSANIQTAIGASVYDAYGAAAARQANLNLAAGTYVNGDMCTYNSSGTLLNCNTPIPSGGNSTEYLRPTSDADSTSSALRSAACPGTYTDQASVSNSAVYSSKSGAFPEGTGGAQSVDGTTSHSIYTMRVFSNWQTTANTYTALSINGSFACAISDTGDNVGGVCGAAYSTDGGSTWTNLYSVSSTTTHNNPQASYSASITGATLSNVQVGVCAVAKQTSSNSSEATLTTYDIATAGTVPSGGGGGTIIHTTISVGTTSVPANSCLPTGTTYSTATMTGVTTDMTFHFGWSADYSAVSGWTPGTPGLYFTAYPTANTLNYQVCNATGTAIVPGSSTTWNVTAQ